MSPIALIPDALPALALLAAGLALIVPSGALAHSVDELLAGLVLVTALDIDPRGLRAVARRWRLVVALAVAPLVVLGAAAWALSALVHGAVRTGVLATGLAPTEVAAVGLVGLASGPAEIAIAVLAGSLVLSALAGPPLLGLLVIPAGGVHALDVTSLLGRFCLVVIVPLAAGLAVRSVRPSSAAASSRLAAAGSVLVALLIYASLSGTTAVGVAGALGPIAAFLAVSTLVAVAAARLLAGGRTDPSLALIVGMRDFAVAAALAGAAGGPPAASVAGIYGVLMLLLGAGVTGLMRARARAAARAA